MNRKRHNKKFFIAIFIVSIITIIVVMPKIYNIKVANSNKVNEHLELGIKYLKRDEYDKAKEELLRIEEKDESYDKSKKLIELIDDYLNLEKLYENKEYVLALDMINKIKENDYLEYIKEEVNLLLTYIDEKILIINKVENMDNEIDNLLNENKYEEATSLVNKYLEEDLEEEYLNKLNALMNKINYSKNYYEEEQNKIVQEIEIEEEVSRGELQEESLNQEENNNAEDDNKKEENKQDGATNENENLGSDLVNSSIDQLDAVEIALEVVRREHPGYGPHYFERGLVTDGEWRWAFVFLKLEDQNAQTVEESNIIGKVGYTVNEKTGEVHQEDWLVQ